MQTIRERLNRIQWDSKEKPDEYTLGYEDRIQKKVININYTDIEHLDPGFMVIKGEHETSIPLHRIRYIKRNNIIVWKRQPSPGPKPIQEKP